MSQKKEIYRHLYMLYGNQEESWNYEELVDIYNRYLLIFLLKEHGAYYGNFMFLQDVVDGFSYYNDQILGDMSTEEEIGYYFLYQHFRGLEKIPLKYLSPKDLNYMLTRDCHEFMTKNHLEEFGFEIGQKMNRNACAIAKVYQESDQFRLDKS